MKEATAALKTALEALEQFRECDDPEHEDWELAHKAITAIKEALAQPEQEPVFLIYDDVGGWIESNENEYSKTEEVNRWLLYTTPPKRPWAGLTDEEIEEAYAKPTLRKMYQAVEAKLKEKNT